MLVPGVVVLLYFARRVRRELGLERRVRVEGSSMGGLPEEVVGIAAIGTMLALWPFALIRGKRVTEFLTRHPWLILRTK